MAQINLKTGKQVVPVIYAYTTPEVPRHDGWIKIGYTEQEVGKRIAQQTHTADVNYKLEWICNAFFAGTATRFTDREFHAYLRKQEIENLAGTEWFHIGSRESRDLCYEFCSKQGFL